MYIPEKFDELQSIMKILGNFFSFQIRDPSSPITLVSQISSDTSECILSFSLPLLKHEIKQIRDITSIIKEKFAKIMNQNRITKVFISQYAFEFVSDNPNLHEDTILTIIKGSVKEIFRDSNIHYHSGYDLSEVEDIYTDEQMLFFESNPILVSITRIILCETEEEVQKQAENQKVGKITSELFISSLGKEKIFYFDVAPWQAIFLQNPIICLHPQKMQNYKSRDELGIVLALIHSLSRSYIIVNSLVGVIFSLEYESWFIEEIRENFEKQFNIVSRFSKNFATKIMKKREDVKRPIRYLLTFVSDKEIYQLMHYEYPKCLFSFIGELDEWLDNQENLILVKEPDEFIEEIIKDTEKFLRSFGKILNKYDNEFASWIQFYNAQVAQNRQLIAIFSLVLAIFSLMFFNFLIPLIFQFL